MTSTPARHGVIVPVKPPAVAKSRLSGLGDDVRRSLAAAFAADTVAACLACESVAVVLAVTDDHLVARDLRQLGAEVVPDPTTVDLNATLRQSAVELDRRTPGLRVAAVCADLPALRASELDRALAAAPPERQGFVADSDRLGTTLVVAPDAASFQPSFGAGSRELHLDAGLVELDLPDIPGLRRDVDVPANLEEVLRLGVGPATSRVTAGLF
jgi:2-phospho-L-lactate/phosphoenolpyruvate guanylyltransferase